MTKSQAVKQTAAKFCAIAYPAPWLFVNSHIELDLTLSGSTRRVVRLVVYPRSSPRGKWYTRIVIEPFGVVNGEMVETDEMPVTTIGEWLARAYIAEPNDIDLTKIPEWAKAATVAALTPHRERIEQAQDVLRGKAG
jgi:hypothetical protein